MHDMCFIDSKRNQNLPKGDTKLNYTVKRPLSVGTFYECKYCIFKSTIWVSRITDHVYFVHPSTDMSLGRYVDRYIGRHIDRHIGRVSVDISTDARPICRSTCRLTLGRYIDRGVSVDTLTDISTEISADISTDTRPICRSICRPRVVVRQSADMSIDRLPTFRRYLTNRTEWSPIWSVIIRVINKTGRPRRGSPIC